MPDKFLNGLQRFDSILRKHRLATLESFVNPDFSFHHPQYGEATFIAENEELFEGLISYLNKEGLGFGSKISMKILGEDTNRYTLIFTPLKDTSKDLIKRTESSKPYWLEETEKFLFHIVSRTENYEKIHKH
jgi:hypothetical protein